ncbi:hypothetical protein PR202_ga05542 [Eleusine coracana subsp. coracana]|uniref:Cysteine proteinase inhibitor n=1 Tax=Eleusine coracana subsp. coracana TaxID=191504 RepID=A0AAV5BTF1_ELECO|nr:hypothetical protein QOZ80_5AG0368410 [Eleusine coracana subsp. coracana]GJM88955.1 hypothetical protein PR202_ga05089 [Eleusine coracana subsp. coracana]GJM89356.1 hypothetical protein PR202_ga05542 [Eleusine coracana subsp. coracana]
MAECPEPVVCGGIYYAPGRENDLEYIERAKFAVAEYNSKTNGKLEYERLVKVGTQVVSGVIYYFTIEVKDGSVKKLYEASVFEKPWENIKKLDSFMPVATDDTKTTANAK